MNKPDFEKCTVEATKLLYQQDVSNRVLNIQNLTYDKTIVFESIQNYSKLTQRPISDFLSDNKKMLHDGCTLYVPEYDCYIVLYNADIKCSELLNWTLGHEIGHIYLEHQNAGNLEEIEAHYFASQLFMPDYTLFMSSIEHGEITVADKEIWEIQKERIDMYYECKKEGWDNRDTLSFWQELKAAYVL